MGEWKKIKLKEVLTEINDRNKGEKVTKVLSVTNSQGFVSQEEYFEGTVHSDNISNYKIVRKNQFAYNPSRVNVGSIDILKRYDEGALSPMYVIFEVDHTKLLPEYFKYYFQTHRFFENVKNNTQGSVRSSLSFKALADFEYLLPPIEEQKKIVKILEGVDKIIVGYEKLLEQKNKFIKAEFVEMFGDPILNSKQLELKKISEISNLKAGKSIKTGELEQNYIDDFYPCYGGNGIRGYINRYSHVGEYPIIGRQGALAGNVNYATGEFYATEHAVVVTPKLEMNILWLYHGLKLLNLMRFQTGVAQPGLAVENINKVEIPFPKLEFQNKFAEIVKLIDKQKEELEKLIKNYKQLKKGLMQKLLTGKVSINV